MHISIPLTVMGGEMMLVHASSMRMGVLKSWPNCMWVFIVSDTAC